MRTVRRLGLILATTTLLTAATVGQAAAQSADPSAPDPLAPVWATGTLHLGNCTNPTTTSVDGVLQQRRTVCGGQEWETSDPRLSGASVSTWNADVYYLPGGPISLRAGTYEVTNEGGGWLCQFADNLVQGQGLFFTPYNDETVTCVGSGGYEGLTAVVVTDWTDYDSVPITALITPAGVPPVP